MQLMDLRRSISDLSKDEGIALILKIRESRMTSKKPEKKVSKQMKGTTQKGIDLTSLSIEQLEMMVREMEEV
mgnify:CR=1 FL=1